MGPVGLVRAQCRRSRLQTLAPGFASLHPGLVSLARIRGLRRAFGSFYIAKNGLLRKKYTKSYSAPVPASCVICANLLFFQAVACIESSRLIFGTEVAQAGWGNEIPGG